MGQIKTLKQQLSDKSFNKLKDCIEEQTGWTVRPVVPDYGVDGEVDIFEKIKGGYKVTPYFFRFQLKSTSKGPNKEPFKTTDIKTWKNNLVPFIIFFWNESENKYYWVNLHEFYSNLEAVDPKKIQQKTITILFENELNKEAFNIIKYFTLTRHRIVEEAIRENEGKKLTVRSLFMKTKKPIIALGYSIKNTDLSDLNMKKSVMMGINLQGSILSNTDLRSSSFMGANFNNANLNGADLRAGSFMGAYFENADLRDAKLQGAAFMGAFVARADFRGAKWDDISLWSISKAYDWEKAKFDKNIVPKIRSYRKIKKLRL